MQFDKKKATAVNYLLTVVVTSVTGEEYVLSAETQSPPLLVEKLYGFQKIINDKYDLPKEVMPF